MEEFANNWNKAFEYLEDEKSVRKKEGIDPKPTIWQGFRPGKSDWERVNRERQAFLEQNFDPRPEWHGYNQTRYWELYNGYWCFN